MTRRVLFYNIAGISGLMLLLVASAVVSRFIFGIEAVYNIVKDFYPVAIAVSGAYLAYCFQRRQAFLASLRDLWEKSIDAKTDLVAYTHNKSPDQIAFGAAHRSISKAIDSVRAVYFNVGETIDCVGFYPLEPLHDMLKTLDSIGFIDVTTDKRERGREDIIHAWNSFRFAFLREFPRAYPPHPVTQRRSRDPRRNPSK